MSSSRVYMKNVGEFGNVVRPMLGIEGSEVVLADTSRMYGFAGQEVARKLVNPATGRDGENNTYPLPLDFRTVGIAIMTARNIPSQTQATMFENFMTRYTRQQRMVFVQQFQSIDPGNTTAINNFVNAMLQMLG